MALFREQKLLRVLLVTINLTKIRFQRFCKFSKLAAFSMFVLPTVAITTNSKMNDDFRKLLKLHISKKLTNDFCLFQKPPLPLTVGSQWTTLSLKVS